MVSFVDKDGKRKRVPTLTASAKQAAAKRAAEKRKRQRRLVRFGGMPEAERYTLARGYYGVSRSPRVATTAGRQIKRGQEQRDKLLRRFMRELQRDPSMANAFLRGMYSRG